MKPWISIPVTLALVYRARSRNSLTPLGIAAAVLTAAVHSIHPWSVFFALLVVFFLAGTIVTKVKHDVKVLLTHSSTGAPGGEGPRTHVQVFANSLTASLLILLHAWKIRDKKPSEQCWPRTEWSAEDLLVSGIVANYAAVAADTFSSELGILSTTKPRLITAPWRIVPLGTNGGVTATGIHAGLLGSFLISATATLLIPFCSQTGNDWSIRSKVNFTLGMSLLGLCGSLLDSILGALLQASVIDVRTGKVIEGDGGTKVPFVRGAGSPRLRKGTKAQATAEETRKEGTLGNQSRKIAVGSDILSNNGVNLLMAATISLASILGSAWFWDVDWTGFFGLPGGLSEVIIYE